MARSPAGARSLQLVPQPQGKQADERGTAADVSVVLPVESGGEVACLAGVAVGLAPSCPAPPGALPDHDGVLGAEAVAVSEYPAAQHALDVSGVTR